MTARNSCTAVNSLWQRGTAVLCTQQSCCNTKAHGLWAHIGFIPWATSNRQTSKLALRRGESRNSLTFILLGRTASDPFTNAWLNPVSLASEVDQPKKVSISGENRLPTYETPATGSTPDASLLHKSGSDAPDRTCVLCPVDLVLWRRVFGALFKN